MVYTKYLKLCPERPKKIVEKMLTLDFMNLSEHSYSVRVLLINLLRKYIFFIFSSSYSNVNRLVLFLFKLYQIEERENLLEFEIKIYL